jgi:hypothetical protein
MVDDLSKANYPLPDPAWDYFVTWNRLQDTKKALEETLNFMQEIENSDDTSDEQVSIKIGDIERMLLLAYETVREKVEKKEEEDLPY